MIIPGQWSFKESILCPVLIGFLRGGQKSNYKIVIFTTIEADSEKSFLGTRVNFFGRCDFDFFLNIKVSLNLDSGHVRICPNLSEKSPTVNKDSRSGSDTRRGLRDLIQYWFWCLPSKYWEIYRCSPPCVCRGGSFWIRTNSDKFGHVRIWNLKKKKDSEKKITSIF